MAIAAIIMVFLIESCGEKPNSIAADTNNERSNPEENGSPTEGSDGTTAGSDLEKSAEQAEDGVEGSAESFVGEEGVKTSESILFSGTIESASYDRDGSILSLDLSFSACEKDNHEFRLVVNRSCGESLPLSCSAELVHSLGGE